MQKPPEALLILSPEERAAAQDFIDQRLRSLEADQVGRVQDLIQSARQQIRRLQADRERLSSGTTTAAQIRYKLTASALSALSGLVASCNRAAHAAPRSGGGDEAADTESAEATEAPGEEVPEELAAFLLSVTPEEEARAADHIKGRLDELSVAELARFRDACRELLTWWESERGQTDGLRIDQYGDTRLASGRVAIRQKRESLRQEILNPFKRFYQEVNSHFQRVSRQREQTRPT